MTTEYTDGIELIQDILTNEPLYKPKSFNSNLYNCFYQVTPPNYNNNQPCIYIPRTYSIAVDDFCEKCKKIRTFNAPFPDYQLCFIFYDINQRMLELKDIQLSHIYSKISDSSLKKDSDDSKGCMYFYDYILHTNCTNSNCGECHTYILRFTAEVKDSNLNSTVVKIGQYPPFDEKEKYELEKYRNLKIVSKYYTELVRSVNAYSQHMGIAAFVYLRRIYEHIVKTEYAKFPENEKNAKASFDEKMKKVNEKINIIPHELDANKSKIYSILSKGIHEYEEDECYDMYPIMKTIIIIVLQKYLDEKEKKKQLNELNKTLSSK